MKNRRGSAFRLLSQQTVGLWEFQHRLAMTALECTLHLKKADHNNNTFSSPLHFAPSFHVTQQRSLLSLSPPSTISPQHLNIPVLHLLSRACHRGQACGRAAAVRPRGKPRPSDTHRNASWAARPTRAFLCGRRAASLIYPQWSWHLNLHGSLWPHHS